MEQKFSAICECLIHTAYIQRLSAEALHHEALFEIITYVNEVAAKSKMFYFVNEPSNLFLVKTSYIYQSNKNILVLILHVPLVTPHNLMPLYEFILMQVHFNFSSNVSVTPDVSVNNMIAVRHSESYQTHHQIFKIASKWGRPTFAKGGISSSQI
jgi:hypothetical protein